MIYVKSKRSEKFEDFIRCHENAFNYSGGVPRECWYDNLATAVSDQFGSLKLPHTTQGPLPVTSFPKCDYWG
jgi:transposase